MARYAFDLETNGLLPPTKKSVVSRLHSVVLEDLDTGEVISCAQDAAGETPVGCQPISVGLEALRTADLAVGHHVIRYDYPVLDFLFGWLPEDQSKIEDTIVITKLIWNKDRLWPIDKKLAKKGFPKNMMGRQSLEAWGHRLGEYKVGTDIKGWSVWTPYMQERCVQDVHVTAALWRRCNAQNYSREAIEIEHEVQWIVARQERRGVKFDQDEAQELYMKIMTRRHVVEKELCEHWFKPWWRSKGTKLGKSPMWLKGKAPGENKKFPKGVSSKNAYTDGMAYTPVEYKEFNPGSGRDVANRLKTLWGWKPTEFTTEGHPKTSEEVLEHLDYPCAPLLVEHAMLTKRMGQIGDGRESWLAHVTDEGLIHGSVETCNCVSGRMSHMKPNLGQVPARVKRDGRPQPYGKECRKLFGPRGGYKQVGIDADALELCCLAGYMSVWDEGAYIEAQLKGSKKNGTDPHSLNAKALGGIVRDTAKTWFYAFIYGAGNPALALYLGHRGSKQKLGRIGAQLRGMFLANLPALGKLLKRITKKISAVGHLVGLDGRLLHIRSAHAALNQLLQSAGAILMKKGLVIFDRDLQAHGLVPGVDYEFILNVHDEWQLEALPEHADLVGKLGCEAITAAGQHFKFPCPITGTYKVGDCWNDTH